MKCYTSVLCADAEEAATSIEIRPITPEEFDAFVTATRIGFSSPASRADEAENTRALLDAGSHASAASLAPLSIEESGKMAILHELALARDDKEVAAVVAGASSG